MEKMEKRNPKSQIVVCCKWRPLWLNNRSKESACAWVTYKIPQGSKTWWEHCRLFSLLSFSYLTILSPSAVASTASYTAASIYHPYSLYPRPNSCMLVVAVNFASLTWKIYILVVRIRGCHILNAQSGYGNMLTQFCVSSEKVNNKCRFMKEWIKNFGSWLSTWTSVQK